MGFLIYFSESVSVVQTGIKWEHQIRLECTGGAPDLGPGVQGWFPEEGVSQCEVWRAPQAEGREDKGLEAHACPRECSWTP